MVSLLAGADFTGIEEVVYDGTNLTLRPLVGEAIVIDASALAR